MKNNYSSNQFERDFSMPRAKYTADEKYNIIQGSLKTQLSKTAYLKQYGIKRSTFSDWRQLFDRFGIDGLVEKRNQTKYSSATKEAAVKAYLAHEGSLSEIARRYGLRSRAPLFQWLKKYRYNETHQQLTDVLSTRRSREMSRKITFEERIQIVEYVTTGKHSYNEAAGHYDVSYQQVRSWVLKAKEHGYESLRDRRGRTKSKDELTELEAANLEIRQLKAQLKEKEYLELFTKKLLEIQRRE